MNLSSSNPSAERKAPLLQNEGASRGVRSAFSATVGLLLQLCIEWLVRLAGRRVRAPHRTLAVVDHNLPTSDRSQGIKDEESRIQVETMARNAKEFGIEYYDERDVRQGIVHVIGPEQGFTLPGTTIV